jgi:hypothetical protein
MRIPNKLTGNERRGNEERKRDDDDHFTAFASSDSMENGGRQSKVFVVWLISTERDPVNLSIADDFPKTAANNLKIEIGNGKIRDRRFNDVAIYRTNAGVEVSIPSDAKNV